MEKEREEEMKKEDEEAATMMMMAKEEEGESERKWLEDAGFEHLVKEYEKGNEVKEELGKALWKYRGILKKVSFGIFRIILVSKEEQN